MRIPLCLILLAGLVATFALGAAFGARVIRVTVNGKALPHAGWDLRNGQVAGPVAPVARALGAQVTWDSSAGTLAIDPPSTWVHINREPNWGYNQPFDYTALGPILTVRHAIAGQQWMSLMKPNHAEDPILVRYEIVDANSEDMMVPPGTDGKQGFTVLAYLYWAYMDPKQDIPRGGARILVSTYNGGGEGYMQEGQKIRQMRLDTMFYEVKPNDVKTVTPTDNPLPKTITVKAIEQGETGWTISRQAVQSSQTFKAGHITIMPPVYDISIQQVRPTAR